MRLIPLAVLGVLLASGAVAAQEADVPKAAPQQDAAPQLPPAQMRADALDRMFAQLHKASERDAGKIEASIWKMWMLSDSPSADAVLGQVAKAMSDKDYVAAMDMANTVIDLYPDYAEAWNKRATLFFIIGRNDESLADIEKVLALEPRHFGALSGRGMIYEKTGKPGLALKAFRDALAIHPRMKSVQEAIERLEDQAQEI
jgi:tetratricopeptide (TPR) repeat protein